MESVKKEITLQDCKELYARFREYTKTAEQHEFSLLFLVNIMLDTTMVKLREAGRVENQKEARSMFRSVLRVIGEDYSAYAEGNWQKVRITEMLDQKQEYGIDASKPKMDMPCIDNDEIADHLIANGVRVLLRCGECAHSTNSASVPCAYKCNNKKSPCHGRTTYADFGCLYGEERE